MKLKNYEVHLPNYSIGDKIYDKIGPVCESYGKKDGRDVLVEVHVHAPGFLKSYELEGITAEMYLTGQGGYLFSKMFVSRQI